MRLHIRMWTMLRVRRWLTIGVTSTVVVLVATLVIVFGFLGSSPQPIHYANVSRNFKVCVLTQTQGADVTAVWKAVQAARSNAPINAQQMTIPTSVKIDPTPYLNGLIALHCELIITNGPNLTDAVRASATANPQTRFITVGDPIDLPNVHTIPTPVSNRTITAEVLTAQETWTEH